MNIPDKALEAAVQALFEDGCGEPKVDAATVLEAAAPFIAAQALRDAAPCMHNKHDSVWLNRRADDLDPQ